VLERVAPALFVLIWSTGWIVAKYAAVAGADPLTFLVVRYAIAAIVIGLFAFAVGADWPRRRLDWVHGLVSGILLHAIYLGGVWWAIGTGLPAGLSALIAALQPLLTIMIARFVLDERVSLANLAGVVIGLVGVGIVLAPRVSSVTSETVAAMSGPILVNIVSMVAVTIGTFYQKRFVAAGDLRSLTAVQYLGALMVTLPVALYLEPLNLPFTREVLYGLVWSVLVLSIGAISLMLMMIRRGAVSKVASLIYLIPPTAAVQAWAMFGETLATGQIAGMVVTAIGVYLATRP